MATAASAGVTGSRLPATTTTTTTIPAPTITNDANGGPLLPTSFLLTLIDSEILTVVSFMRRNAKFLHVSQNMSLAFALLESPIPQTVSLGYSSATSFEDLLSRRLTLLRWAANPEDVMQHHQSHTSLASPTALRAPGSPRSSSISSENVTITRAESPPVQLTNPDQDLDEPERQSEAALTETRPLVGSPSLAALAMSPPSASTSAATLLQPRSSGPRKSISLPGHVLIQGFEELQKRLATVDVSRPLSEQISPLFLLTPFLRIVQSGDTTGPITGAAVSSIEKFIHAGVIDVNETSQEMLPQLLSMIVHTVTHAKFEATDANSDETVLWRILSLLRTLFASPLHRFLSDEAVCQMFEMGIGMWMMRLSELLRRSTEQTLTLITRQLFSRLDDLRDQAPPADDLPVPDLGRNRSSISLPVSPDDDAFDMVGGGEPGSHASPGQTHTRRVSLPAVNSLANDTPGTPHVFAQYGLPSIMEVLRVFVSIIDTSTQSPHSDTSRVLALHLLQTAVETAGPALARFPSIVEQLTDTVLRHLLFIVRMQLPNSASSSVLSMGVGINAVGSGNMSINVVVMAYRLILLIWQTLHSKLKCQLEVILNHVMERWNYWNGTTSPSSSGASGASGSVGRSAGAGLPSSTDRSESTAGNTPYGPALSPERYTPASSRRPAHVRWEVREALLELFVEIVKTPHIFTMLYVNYDCDMHAPFLFEEFMQFLATNVHVDDHNPTSNVLYRHCFEAILVFLKEMESAHNNPHLLDISVTLEQRRAEKVILLDGARHFNEGIKQGIKYLQTHRVLPEVIEPRVMARFLRTTPNLSKTLIGEYLGKPDNIETLRQFVAQFHFGQKRIDEAVRELLESFRLPGEAQQIDRIMNCFAEVYFAGEPAYIAEQDGAYVLAYAIVMLNTDQHNPQIRRRMAFESFQRNLRGQNSKEDFAPEFLRAIYEAIQSNEIVMPAEHEGEVGFNYQWKQLMARAGTHGHRLDVLAGRGCQRKMFLSVWGQLVSALSFVFDTCGDKEVALLKAVEGLHLCSQLSHLHSLPDVIDNIVISLSNVSGLLEDPKDFVDYPADLRRGEPMILLPRAVELGQDVKAQLAAVMMFNMSRENVNEIREGWINVFGCLRTLFLHNLVPQRLLEIATPLLSEYTIPRLLRQTSSGAQQRASASLFSFFSYLATATGADAGKTGIAPTVEEKQVQKMAFQCIEACHLAAFVHDSVLDSPDSLRYVYKALQTFCIMPTGSKGGDTPQGSRPDLSPAVLDSKRFDPSAPLFVHIMFRAAARNLSNITLSWPIIRDLVGQIATGGAPTALLKQVIVDGTALCQESSVDLSIRQDVFAMVLAIGKQPRDVAVHLTEPLIKAVELLLPAEPGLLNSAECRTDLLQVVQLGLLSDDQIPQCVACLKQLVAYHVELDGMLSPQRHTEMVGVLSAAVAATMRERGAGGNGRGRSPADSRAASPSSTKPYMHTMTCLELLYSLHRRLLAPEHLEGTIVASWQSYWVPLLAALSQHIASPLREVSQYTLSLLQRLVLLMTTTACASESQCVISLFEDILLPLLDGLQKPTMAATDDVKAHAVSMLCKDFLQLMPALVTQDLERVWTQLLSSLTKCLTGRCSEYLRDAVSESLKNVILVMCASNVLQPPAAAAEQASAGHTLWSATWEQVHRVLPDLQQELFPPAPPPPRSPPSSPRSLPVQQPTEATGGRPPQSESTTTGKTSSADHEQGDGESGVLVI
ncbi:GDP/GTP exchange factor for ARF [Sorochytrium milnesiophthora]